MRKAVTVLAVVTAMASGVSMTMLQIAVQTKTEEVQKIADKIREDRRVIRFLEAELAYQTTPNQLQEQSNRFLALMAPKARQILSDPSEIPLRPAGVMVDGALDLGVALSPEVSASNPRSKNDRRKRKQGANTRGAQL